MSECENQSACIDESKIEHYVEKKNNYIKERNKKACASIAFTLFVTILYYGDIITDLFVGDILKMEIFGGLGSH